MSVTVRSVQFKELLLGSHFNLDITLRLFKSLTDGRTMVPNPLIKSVRERENRLIKDSFTFVYANDVLGARRKEHFCYSFWVARGYEDKIWFRLEFLQSITQLILRKTNRRAIITFQEKDLLFSVAWEMYSLRFFAKDFRKVWRCAMFFLQIDCDSCHGYPIFQTLVFCIRVQSH